MFSSIFHSTNTITRLLLLLCCLPVFAQAATDTQLYEVTLSVPDESTSARNAAMAEGLAQVMVRISGDSDILQKLTRPEASGYVKQFRYLAGAGSSASRRLWLQYNATRVMDYLRKHGAPIWGDQRVVSVVWLAVRDGNNQYLLKSGKTSALKKRAEKLFEQRGIPVIWPKYDKQDRLSLTFADVWGGFSSPLLQASSRYGSGSVLAGKMAWDGREWSIDWSLMGEHITGRWSARDSKYEKVLTDSINQVANSMGQHYALLEAMDGQNAGNVVLEIDNVTSLPDFARLQKYLANLQAVQQVQLAEIGSQHARFNLTLRSRVEDFLGRLRTSREIKPASMRVVPQADLQTPSLADPQVMPQTVTASPQVYYYQLVN